MDNTKELNADHPKSSLLNKIIKIGLPILVGGLILYFLFRDTDFEQLKAVLSQANWYILLLSLPFGILGNTMRAYRWNLLIRPLGYEPRLSTLVYAVYGSYAVNFAIPRGGEIWRCGIVAKEEKIPFVKLVGTVILDRILDIVMVVVIVSSAFLFNMQFFISYINSNEKLLSLVQTLVYSPYLYIIIVVGVLGMFVVFKYFGENKIVKKVTGLVIGFWSDLKAMGQMKEKSRLILYSILLWIFYFLHFYIAFYAFGFTKDLGITAGLIAFAISSLSMMIPTNGGMGAWHAAIIAALLLYSVDTISAEAFAVAVFGVQTLWVLVYGFYGIIAISSRKQLS
ncbi:lysylphosphatidylglycerol synthase transmembrane domain-containing protein [Dysgonomonas massiliensis]|uniref:lysylphosphatidylglycerol synthase transmembrane domain-containing protein n=1 Tax=Dysgonomonas massiliensis TaxID=2040292 RepID=UPI000C784BE7|nr:lysylphosphatidylglycerol synthase transmembrane domain-containing protein [Dysgonomonas massiliensis]